MRTTRKALFSALLVLSAIPLLLTPTVSSQSYTTITAWTTETGQVTSTSYSTFAVATTTLTSTVTNTYGNYSFTLPALSARYCYYDDANGTFHAGDRLIGKVVTSSVMDFYVMSSAQFQTFSHGRCDQQYPALVTARDVISSYPLDFVVPADDVYYFVFFNYASWGSGTNQVVGSFSLAYVVSQSATSTLSSTVSNSIAFATTRTASSAYSSTVQTSPGLALPTSYIEYLMVIVVLGAIAVGAILISRKRARKPTAAKERTSKVKARKGVQFCINCGAELPRDSKFCNKCGSAQV